MKKYLSFLFVIIVLGSQLGFAQGVFIRPIFEEIIVVITKKGGKELAELGGKEGLKETLEYIAKEGGETAVKRTLMYSKIYGSSAVNAIKASPKKVTEALDSIPSEYKRNLISIVNKNPSAIAKRLDSEGIPFLKLEAKFPSMGSPISKLGSESSQVAFDLSKREAVSLARNAPCLEAAKKASPQQYAQFLESLKKAPEKTLALLEKSPKVLFTGAALIAFTSSKEELFKEGGIVEESVQAPLKAFMYCLFGILLIFISLKIYPFIKRHKKNKA